MNKKIMILFRCVYGKVQHLSIDIPWTNLIGKPINVSIKGLYMLVVPATSIGYDQQREEKAERMTATRVKSES